MERWPAAMLVSTAAQYLDCSPSQVEKLIKDRAFGCIQYNTRGDRRILREEIDAYLSKRRDEPVLSVKEGGA